MEKKTSETAKDDDNLFNCIQLNNPTVHISSSDKSNIWNDTNYEIMSDFISVKSTVTSGITPTSYIEVKKLQKLLISRKDDIDHILESQPVYAIGIDFQKDSTRPCIACWVDRPLGIHILECLETLFEEQYEAIYQVILEDIEDNNDQNLNNNKKDIIANGIIFSSEAIVTVDSVEPVIFQKFTITARIWAEITSSNILEFEVDVLDCKTGNMLSRTNSPLFKKHGYGYFIDSIEVCVSPIARTSNNNMKSLFTTIGAAFPQKLNRNVELSTIRESNVGGQFNGEFGIVPKIVAQANGNVKYVDSVKSISDEWDVNHCGCGTTGDLWSHHYTAHELDKDGSRRTSYSPRKHSNTWRIWEEMGEFRITITQVLRYKPVKQKFFVFSRPKLILCTMISHNFEITFKDLENLNTKLAKLDNGEIYRNKNDINIKNPDPIIQNLDESIKMKHSFVKV
ncbi:8228_t:CDS:2 [Funneliformis caledonium]|uniref:8228_t:CDS:1 n=1 Tax=Funneliformis caledonium TaxID=1117310 RepID=A0A9N8WF64_9GLOM|nr:8228_t:CDS:2 [Funneliformis caledonium]